ncbi:MAG: RagB/SusD family nutrient uptake outer membrane protein [Sphingobacterium composti]
MARGTLADWQEVVTLTNDIISNSGHPLTTKSQTTGIVTNGVLTNPESGFNNVATPSWIWGTDLTIENGLLFDTFWAHMDYYTYGYASSGDAKLISKDLYDLIPATDIRKRQFHATRLYQLNKFFDPARVWDGQNPVTCDYLYMRADEFYLLNAEANANLSQDAAARSTLKRLLDLRLDDASYINTLSGQALKDEIYLQTRIELWGEGKIYLYNKRNKKSITTASNHYSTKGEVIPYDAQKLTFPIPQAEILNNLFITR